MIFELTLMAVSGIVMAALLAHKHLELSRGIETRVREVRAKADPILSNLHHKTGRFFSYITLHNAVLLANFVFVHAVRFLMEASHAAHKAFSRLVERASRKTEDLSKGGAASFYLKQIKEDKGAPAPSAPAAPTTAAGTGTIA
ncbi:MAG TPA: hypothetical protein VFQ72_03140 [Candidatus Paceibacterota bacterium]|nr:hypothetical protein [Candidatus Paceibacterota bacterium]